MDKVYEHSEVEEKIYNLWEQKGYFRPEINPNGKPYSIILPPPNANGDLHFGHAMFVIEDILIRYRRMKGDQALWLPGTDHAGTETQFVFEKKLQSIGKSRFDFTREELFKMIEEYVIENQGGIERQLKRLGFSLDWSRQRFTLDKGVVGIVNQTFRRMYDEGLVYRDYRLVNYCTKDGTSFSDLEVFHEERQDPLYYIKYGPLVLATTRPETKFGDTGVAVHPGDKRYQQYIGKEIDIQTVLGPARIRVVGDESVDPGFGTGVVKITPAHDFNDFEVGKRHNLPLKQVIGFDGKLNTHAGKFSGLYVKKARAAIVEEMQEKGLMEKIDTNYTHRIGLCYKCKTVLEPLPLEQWYIKIAPLAKNALSKIEDQGIRIYPSNFKPILTNWYKNLRDWNISRQNVWGIRIPIWYLIEDESQFTVTFIDSNKTLRNGSLKEFIENGVTLAEVNEGLQKVVAAIGVKIVFEDQKDPGKRYLPETDTFDTWFSSAQWPYVTLLTTGVDGDFEKFYPTSVMETGRDILFFWVSRMIMMGLYFTSPQNTDVKPHKGVVPFNDVILHGIVNDPLGKKMSKSKGNVVNPLEVADQYGADAVRFALIYGTALGNDQSMSYPKLEASRKFMNKLWNMARFLEFQQNRYPELLTEHIAQDTDHANQHEFIQKMNTSIDHLISEVTLYIEKYQFNLAAEKLYDFAWHEFADLYIEEGKQIIELDAVNRLAVFTALVKTFTAIIKLLHPFMPFVTEEIYQKLPLHTESIMIAEWPTA